MTFSQVVVQLVLEHLQLVIQDSEEPAFSYTDGSNYYEMFPFALYSSEQPESGSLEEAKTLEPNCLCSDPGCTPNCVTFNKLLDSLQFPYLLKEDGNNSICFIGLLKELSELICVTCLEQYLAHNNTSVRLTVIIHKLLL